MHLVPKRDHLVLLIGDILVFALSLYLTLALRYLSLPARPLLMIHAIPFAILFVAWILVFFLAGLYGRHTRLFRHQLPTLILAAQAVNILIAAAFFFFIPVFGIAPKTNLALYLVVWAPLIYLWRVLVFPRVRFSKPLRGLLIASGPDARELAAEVRRDARSTFSFAHVLDTSRAPTHEVIQRACRVAEDKDVSFVVVDHSDAAVAAALPIIYEAAFHKQRFALVDIMDLYQEVFERVPLSLTKYGWLLQQVGSASSYDVLKRVVDMVGGVILGTISLVFYPLVCLAIKLDDGGPIFIVQERVGRFQRPIRMYKFRTMSGNDHGEYKKNGKSELVVTRVGKWLRVLRIDELPQLWSIVRGDLSLVGPRPELPALAAQYNARIPYYNARYLVAPGLTGWAQIRHDRDPHHGTAIEETKEKLSYDLYYLRHRSFFLDLFILLQTVRIVVSARGS